MSTKTAAAANSLDSMFRISCGRCGKDSPALDWTATPTGSPLPIADFQCPACNYAFRRVKSPRSYGPAFVLEPIDPTLL